MNPPKHTYVSACNVQDKITIPVIRQIKTANLEHTNKQTNIFVCKLLEKSMRENVNQNQGYQGAVHQPYKAISGTKGAHFI